MKSKILSLVGFATLLVGCSSAIDNNGYSYDPWEPVNRKIFVFNDALDTMLLKPIATGYQAIMPDFGERRVNAFFGNLDDVGSFFNSVLQFEFEQSSRVLARILNNTFFGLGGLFDVATPMGNIKIKEDFGSTLDHYGLASGPYVVLPFFGPSTVRDGFGGIVDTALFEPVTYLNPQRDRWIVKGTEFVQNRANLLSAERAIGNDVGDKYLLIRDSWLQYRWKQLYGDDSNQAQQQAIDDIFEAELQQQ